ncbi:MAG: rRNA maturation RNase YbeY [Candidatus Paceibacterota bacterium]
MQDDFSVVNKTKGKIPNLPFSLIKKDILNDKYHLSLAFISKEKMQKFNNEYRKINKATNILSFSLSKNEGEILICPTLVKEQTKKFNRTFPQLLQFLVIHGMLHLKGMEHSSRMDRAEEFYDKKYFNWNRCRIR